MKRNVIVSLADSNYYDLLNELTKSLDEDIVIQIAKGIAKETGEKNLCLAGGVGQNSVANGKILLNTPFENIYIPSAAHDAGTSIGSAYYLYNHIFLQFYFYFA